MLSGLDTARHGVKVNGQHVPDDVPWIPEMLQKAGWVTQAFVSAGVLDGDLGFARGFDRYDSTFGGRLWSSPLLRLFVVPHTELHRRDDADTVRLVGKARGMRVFTWIHLYGV